MRLSRLFMRLHLLGWLVTQPVLADIDPAEYEFKSSVRSEKESQRLKAEFEADRQRSAERQRQEAENAAQKHAQKQAQEKAAWDALPYPVRLTRTRCTACHAADNYIHQRHNRIGWELIVLRMQYLNKTPLGPGERSVIAAHLTETYPVSGVAGLAEALRQFAVVLSPVWLWLGWTITSSRFKTRR